MFRDALRVVEETLRSYEEARSREFPELSRVGIIAATIVSDVLVKIRSLMTTLSTIENSLENPKQAVTKLCEGLIYVNDNKVTSVIHKVPFTSISYNKEEDRISISSRRLSTSLKGATLEVRFRNYVTNLNILAKEDLEKYANIIKALASEKLELINYAITITESCRKKLGLR